MLYEEFKAYSADVIRRFFEGAPAPDGKTETNREHYRRRDLACAEILIHLKAETLTPEERDMRYRYATDQAQAAIYALFPSIKRKPKRYK